MTHSWDSFFVAQVGASAALTGLVFVALSINLARIIDYPQLVGRAGEAVILLVQPVVLGLAVLAPDHSTRTVGLLTAVGAFGAAAIVGVLLKRGAALSRDRPRREVRTRATMVVVALLPAMIGSIVLLTGSTAGVGWIALGAVLAICAGIFDAWVLLVEILR
jgi:hypothetical protein